LSGTAAEAFQSCLHKRPEWAEASLNAAIALARSGDPASARPYFEDTLAMRPDSRDALRGLAALALDRRQWREALEYHRQLIELGDRSPEIFYNAGLICQKQGETAGAVDFYRRAVAEDPRFAEAVLNLGHALMSLGQEDEARSCWSRAVRQKPELAANYFDPA